MTTSPIRLSDEEVARAVAELNEAGAKKRMGARKRIKVFLRQNVGKVVTSRQLQEVAGANVTEWARRVREIRNDDGWNISTHNDDSNLKPGEYRLDAEPPEKSRDYNFASTISARLRAQVLERNGYTCMMCGATAGDPDERNPNRKVRLHIGHIKDRSHGGTDTLDNLRALCSTCNQGAQNIVQEPPSWTLLLAQVRRASVGDQKKALEWLLKKFPNIPRPSEGK